MRSEKLFMTRSPKDIPVIGRGRRRKVHALGCAALSEWVVMHLQIVEAGEGVTRRYVANRSHRVRQYGSGSQEDGTEQAAGMLDDHSGLGGCHSRIIGSMDGNPGRSEGATAEKAVPSPCAVLDPRPFVC